MAEKSAVQQVTIQEGQAGQRIDNFLFTRFKDIPKGHIYRILRTGQVRVNKGRIKATYRIQAGDILRIPPLATDAGFNKVQKGTVPKSLLDQMAKSILYEDSNLMIVNKPSGLAVHGGTYQAFGLIDVMQQMGKANEQLQLAHRLDRETSGCLILSKNRQSLVALHDMLKKHEIEKSYTTLLEGIVRPAEQRVTAKLSFDRSDSAARKAKVSEEGKVADTFFTVMDWMKDVSLVEVKIATGRTHQIRAHANHIGHPVAGDDKYGDNDFNAKMRGYGLKRLFLHAAMLKFTFGGRPIKVKAPLPDDLKKVLEAID